MSAPRTVIEVTGLSKAYGEVQAVDDLSFHVEEGQLFAFLGPNGAGKSTVIDIICTFLQRDAGEVRVGGFQLGREDDQIRSIIGAVFQDGLLDAHLTVAENMRVRGSFYGLRGTELVAAIDTAARAADVTSLMDRPYGKLSGGQRRRADIARALVHTPKILFLDEPTTGLDPQTRQSVWDTITALQREHNMTVFLTTHYMEEATEADYVVIIDEGRIAAEGTPAQLREKYASDTLTMASDNPAAIEAALNGAGIPFERIADQVVVRLESTLGAIPVIDWVKPHLRGFEVVTGTMDEAFIAVTGKDIRG